MVQFVHRLGVRNLPLFMNENMSTSVENGRVGRGGVSNSTTGVGVSKVATLRVTKNCVRIAESRTVQVFLSHSKDKIKSMREGGGER